MKTVLMYNIGAQKGAKIKVICHKMKLKCRAVSENELNLKLSELLESDVSPSAEALSLGGEMLYLSGLSDIELRIFLAQLRAAKTPVALKAIATETNLGFTSRELYAEILAEHEAMRNNQA